MKYTQPYNNVDPDAPFVDGNPSTGIEPSIIPAAAIEGPQREIVRTISDIGLAFPTNLDLTQLSEVVRFMRLQYVEDTGPGANDIVVTLDPAPVVWATPLSFVVRILNTNTTAAVNCTITSLTGAKNVLRFDGQSLQAGDLVANGLYLFVYDGVSIRSLGGGVSGAAPPPQPVDYPTAPGGFFFIGEEGGYTILAPGLNTMLEHFTYVRETNFLDPASSAANSRLTIGKKDAGVWFLAAYYGHTFQPGYAGNTQLNIAICVNGNEDVGFASTYSPSQVSGVCQSTMIRLYEGDVVQVQACQFHNAYGFAEAGYLSGVRMISEYMSP